jgi:diguanylate cyclase (GGDEF)-like protein
MAISEKETSPEISERIYAEQVSLLYTGSVFRPTLHIISLILFILIIIKHVNPAYAYTWAFLLIGLNVYRFIDIYKTQKIINEIKDYKVIHKRYACCAGLLGAIYGLGLVFFFSELPMLNQVYLMTLVAVLTPAGFVSFASDKLSFNLYLYCMVLPIIIRLFAVGQIEYFNIGASAIIYMIIMKKLFLWNYDILIKWIRLKYENEQLLNSLQGINARLTELSVIDELTQVANRRSLDDNLEKEWSRARRMSAPISMLMIDIDYFKQYNDEFGHIKGDECLIYLSDYLKTNLNRSGDFIARYGGEEFCVIMPDTNMDGAIKFAEKIHSGVRDLKVLNPGSQVSKYLTISIGLASAIPVKKESYVDLIYTSDKALYIAKNDGRNIIRTIETLVKNPKPQLVV